MAGFPNTLNSSFTTAVTSTGEVTARSGAATAVVIGAAGPASQSGISFQNAEASSQLYRSSAGILVCDGQLRAGSFLVAANGNAVQVNIGAAGPAGQSGIIFQNAEAGSNLYRSAAGVLTTDGAFVVGGASLTLNGDGAAAVSIVAGTVNGLKIGTAVGQKIGFYNTAPVVQAAAITAPAATGSSNVTPFGYTTAAQADAIVTAVRALQLAVKNLGLTA